MVLARVATWNFKRSMRIKGFDALEKTVFEATRKTKGFRGSLTLLPVDDLSTGVIITLWENEDSLKTFVKNVFPAKAQALEQYVTGPPKVKLYRVFSAELKQ